MILLILTLVMIAGGIIWYNYDDFSIGSMVLIIFGGIGLAIVSVFSISALIDNEVYFIEYEELVVRAETSEYSQELRENIYEHNRYVRRCKKLNGDPFIGIFYPNNVSNLPTIEYKQVSQENKTTLIKGE